MLNSCTIPFMLIYMCAKYVAGVRWVWVGARCPWMPLDCYMFLIFAHILLSIFLLQSIQRKRTGRRASGKAWSAPSLWRSSSASCSSQPIRCCGTAWSDHSHCEHGGQGGQNSHDLTFSPLCSQSWTDHNPRHFWKQSTEFVSLYHLLIHVCFFIYLYF